MELRAPERLRARPVRRPRCLCRAVRSRGRPSRARGRSRDTRGAHRQEPRRAVGRHRVLGLLATVREFAAGRLDERSDADAIRRRHAEHVLAVVGRQTSLRGTRRGGSASRSPDATKMSGRRWTMRRLRGTASSRSGSSRPWAGSGTSVGISPRGGADWKAALAAAGSEQTALRATACMRAGAIADALIDVAAAERFYREALAIRRSSATGRVVRRAEQPRRPGASDGDYAATRRAQRRGSRWRGKWTTRCDRVRVARPRARPPRRQRWVRKQRGQRAWASPRSSAPPTAWRTCNPGLSSALDHALDQFERRGSTPGRECTAAPASSTRRRRCRRSSRTWPACTPRRAFRGGGRGSRCNVRHRQRRRGSRARRRGWRRWRRGRVRGARWGRERCGRAPERGSRAHAA